MRRARIKAVATVPVRRKAVQDGTTESIEQIDTKPADQPALSEQKVDTTATCISNENETKSKEIEKIVAPENLEILSTSPVKEKESTNSNTLNDITITEQKCTSQSVPSPHKSPIPSIEGSGPPVKVIHNRSCFMRPSPRLDGGGRIRRNSVQGSGASASESEDDSRRPHSIASNRVRNDSVCSIQSLKDNNNANIVKLNLGHKRRMIVSESARKLAEARREFHLKHENKAPDKSKLTMYDLIYYNPVTNPMKPKPVTPRPATRKNSICSIADSQKDEEVVDEPSEMLVPQVKVGPNGQLIIDEQSLVIDQYKAQENIDRSDIIVDEDTTGNGFYKRRQKSKDWNKWETMKFYKALNTYGTDFLLMQSIFPKRTREELKLKYKKEEKLNRNLIEKALMYQEFDTDALEKDLANVEESERKELESSKIKNVTSLSSRKKRKRCYAITEEINCENDELYLQFNKNDDKEQPSDEDSRITITKKIKKRKRKVTKPKDNILNKISNDNSDSESEIYEIHPTRSGRVPRKTKKAYKPIKVFDVDTKSTKNDSQTQKKRINRNKKIKEIEINDSQISENIEGFNNLADNTTDKIKNNALSENSIVKENNEKSKNCEELKSNEVSNNLDKSKNTNLINENADEQVELILSKDTIKESGNQNPILKALENNTNISSDMFNDITDDLSNVRNLKPGSLVVVKKDCNNKPGKKFLQVYIVSADYDVNNSNYKDSLVPIDLSPDVLESVTSCIKNIEPQNIRKECSVP